MYLEGGVGWAGEGCPGLKPKREGWISKALNHACSFSEPNLPFIV